MFLFRNFRNWRDMRVGGVGRFQPWQIHRSCCYIFPDKRSRFAHAGYGLTTGTRYNHTVQIPNSTLSHGGLRIIPPPLGGAAHRPGNPPAAAPATERASTTLAKMARPSRSGSFGMAILETMCFQSFHLFAEAAPYISPMQAGSRRPPALRRTFP